MRKTPISSARAASSNARADRPNRVSRSPNKAASGAGAKSRAAASASRANTPACVSPSGAAGGGFDLDPPAREFGGDAPRDGDVRSDQRRGAAGRVERFAHRAGQRQSLLVLVGGLDDRHAGERALRSPLRGWPAASARSRRQASVELAGRSASLRKRARAASAGSASPSGRTASRPTPTISSSR